MRTFRDKYFSELSIEENIYKVDFIILEKYQTYTSELLRLSLLCLGIIGFLVPKLFFDIKSEEKGFGKTMIKLFQENEFLIILSIIFLILCSCTALSHNYFSTDSMTHQVRKLRLQKKKDELQNIENKTNINYQKIESILETIEAEKKSFESDLKKCKWALLVSTVSLILGVLFIFIALRNIFFFS